MKTLINRLIKTVGVFTSLAISAPSEDIDFLMSQPASIFDLGMVRLDSRLREISREQNIDITSSYKFDRNELKIVIHRNFKDELDSTKIWSKEEAIQFVQNAFEFIRMDAGVLGFDRKFIGDKTEGSYYSRLFSHNGYNMQSTEKKSIEINKILKIYVWATYGNSKLKRWIMLTGNLYRKDPTIGDFEKMPEIIYMDN